MPRVSLRFYAELNDHLPVDRRHVRFTEQVRAGVSLGEMIASLGVPPGEVELILVNGESVGLCHPLTEGDDASVYPSFDSLDVAPLTRIIDRPPRRMRFVLDVHLGKLAHHLRMLGFDTLYRNDYTTGDLTAIAGGEDRILLSRSRTLVEGSGVTAAYCVVSTDPREQLIEILVRFDLWRSCHPFSRCLHCNTTLRSVARAEVVDRLPAKVRDLFLEFNTCPSCDRIYWSGSHFERMNAFIDEVFVGQARRPLGRER